MENSKKSNNNKIIFIGISGVLALLFVWHIIFTFSLSNKINSYELEDAQNSVDEVEISINRITNLVKIKVPLPPQIDDGNSFGDLGVAMAEMFVQNIGPGMIERELNVAARERFNLYAILIPFSVKIETVPASDEAVEQARIEHQQRMEQLEIEREQALEELKREREQALAELQREREERERIREEERMEQQTIKDNYINEFVSLENVRVSQGERFGMPVEGVFGTLINNGNRTLNKVTITIYFLNEQGQRIGEKSYSPVLVSALNFGDNSPLRPSYRKDFGYSVEDDAPSNWSKRIEAIVSDIEFDE